MNNKITEEIITQERKKFIEELIQNSIISKDKLKSSELENKLTKTFIEVEKIIKSKDNQSLSYVYDTIINNFFLKIDIIMKNTPGLTIGLKDVVSNGELYIYYGKTNSKTDASKVDEDTRFDLASVTKLFTATSILKKQEQGKLDLQKSIYHYNNQFINLKNISLEDTAKFYYQINTDGRLDTVLNKEQLLSNLYNSKVVKSNTLVYSDIPYIILGEILNQEDEFSKYFQEELGMVKTSYDVRNKIITGGNYNDLNSIHDKKAQNMITFGMKHPGHAGIYSTSEDLVKLGTNLLPDHNFLTRDSLKILSTPSRGEYQFQKEDKLVNKNRAMGVYIPTEKGITESDIALQASKNTIASSGTTGPYILIDPKNNFTFNYLCNPYSKEGGYTPIELDGKEVRWSRVSNIIKEELVNLVYELRFAYNISKNIALTNNNTSLYQETEAVFASKHIIRK